MIRQIFRYISIFFFLCLLAWGAPARAQAMAHGACPEGFPAVASDNFLERRREILRLQSLASACLLRADYFAYQGQLLLLQESYVDALVSLERSLLLDGERPGVQLDYVIALSRTGDTGSARALARQVLARDGAPPAVKSALEAVLRDEDTTSVGAVDLSPWQWRGYLMSMVGVDSNLNSATSADTINLTLPNGNVPLTLEGSSKPQLGHALLFSGQIAGQADLWGGVLSVQGDWRERQAPGHMGLAYSQQDASAIYRSKELGGWVPRLAASSFSMGGATLFTGLTGSMWREFPGALISAGLSACTSRAGVESERRTYPQDASQNGVYASVLAGLQCVRGEDHFQWGVQAGRDWSSSAVRAGGDQTRVDLKGAWDRQWGWGSTTAEWIVSELRDSAPYSDILGGVVRSTTRQNLRLSLTKRLNLEDLQIQGGALYAVTTMEVLRHRSNLELFDVRGHSLYTGLRYEF